MSPDAYFPKPQATLAFDLAGRPGRIAVYYGPNDDQVKAGFDSIPGLQIAEGMCHGYPVMHARVESYAGSGYRTLCAWIQVITREGYPTVEERPTEVRRSSSVDLPPAFSDCGVPFIAVGPLPTVFDAPCRNLGDNTALVWTADTFLTTSPLKSKREEVSRLASFRWGYREYAPSAGRPVSLLPLQVTGAEAWDSHLPLLRREFGVWNFREG